jgi:hypothetical protein
MVGRGSGKTEKGSQGKMTVRRSITCIAGELPSPGLRGPGSADFRCFVPYSGETRFRVASTFSSFGSLALPRPLELL